MILCHFVLTGPTVCIKFGPVPDAVVVPIVVVVVAVLVPVLVVVFSVVVAGVVVGIFFFSASNIAVNVATSLNRFAFDSNNFWLLWMTVSSVA